MALGLWTHKYPNDRSAIFTRVRLQLVRATNMSIMKLCPRAHGDFWLHKPLLDHPENPQRLDRIVSTLRRMGLEPQAYPQELEHPNPLDLAGTVHDTSHVNRVIRAASRAPTMLDSDTYISPGSLKAAGRALSYAHAAARVQLEEASCRVEFLLPRPPGHHAGVRGAALGAPSLGFCLFNNIAVTARLLSRELGGGVVVLDFDVHHGNGTQEIFQEDPSVLHIDIHQDPSTLYPGTGWPWDRGTGRGKGTLLNLVLPPGAGDDVFADAVEKGVEWALERLGREGVSALLVSAGFDAYENDGLAGLRVGSEGYWRAARVLTRVVDNAGIPLLVFLEGGYSRGLVRGVEGFVRGLRGLGQGPDRPRSSPQSVWRRYLEWRNTALRG